jgi:hypothetical protein
MHKVLMTIVLLSSSLIQAAPIVDNHIVFVSDSHGNCAFGETINQKLRTRPNSFVHSLSIGGSSPATWLDAKRRWVSPLGVENQGYTGQPVPHPRKLVKTPTPRFSEFLTQSFLRHPTVQKTVVINLGTNAITPDVLIEQSKQMVQDVHAQNANCAWISPPPMARWPSEKLKKYREAIEQGIALAGKGGPANRNCQLINSEELVAFPLELPRGRQNDGIHYCWHPELIKRAQEHASKVFQQLFPPEECADENANICH